MKQTHTISTAITMKPLSYDHGPYFPNPVRFIGFGFHIAGTASILGWLGAPLLMIGLILVLARSGVQLDQNEKQYREYFDVLGWKNGGWKPLELYRYVSVLSTRVSQTSYSSSHQSITVTDSIYKVCLLSANHREKLAVQYIKDYDEAMEQANTLAQELHLPRVKYDPPAHAGQE